MFSIVEQEFTNKTKLVTKSGHLLLSRLSFKQYPPEKDVSSSYKKLKLCYV